MQEKQDATLKPNPNNLLAPFIIIFMMPATIIAGVYLLDDRKYYVISLLIVCYILAFFFLMFENARPRAREIVVLSVMIAITVMGRAAFFMVPQFKPMVALVIITGVGLGAEAGFIVGAMSAFISNFIFGQGPWTPWQMFALGLIGFLAGILFEKRAKGWRPGKRRIVLSIFGAFASFFLYSCIVDIWTVLSMTPEPKLGTFLMTYGLALPFNIIHSVATAVFIVLLANYMLDKLERVKMKFGLLHNKSLLRF